MYEIFKLWRDINWSIDLSFVNGKYYIAYIEALQVKSSLSDNSFRFWIYVCTFCIIDYILIN